MSKFKAGEMVRIIKIDDDLESNKIELHEVFKIKEVGDIMSATDEYVKLYTPNKPCSLTWWVHERLITSSFALPAESGDE